MTTFRVRVEMTKVNVRVEMTKVRDDDVQSAC